MGCKSWWCLPQLNKMLYCQIEFKAKAWDCHPRTKANKRVFVVVMSATSPSPILQRTELSDFVCDLCLVNPSNELIQSPDLQPLPSNPPNKLVVSSVGLQPLPPQSSKEANYIGCACNLSLKGPAHHKSLRPIPQQSCEPQEFASATSSSLILQTT